MEIQIKKLDNSAKLPEYAHAGDAGMDIFSVEEAQLAPGERKAIRTGIGIGIPEGCVGFVWDKSGRAVEEGLKTMAGVIDSGYRGEVQIVLVNLGQEPITLEKHQKIAQLVVQPIVTGTVVEVDELNNTSRGEGGFGSTGLS